VVNGQRRLHVNHKQVRALRNEGRRSGRWFSDAWCRLWPGYANLCCQRLPAYTSRTAAAGKRLRFLKCYCVRLLEICGGWATIPNLRAARAVPRCCTPPVDDGYSAGIQRPPRSFCGGGKTTDSRLCWRPPSTLMGGGQRDRQTLRDAPPAGA
jgi:hypothetical protein